MGMDFKQTGDTYQFDLKNGVVIEIERLSEEAGGLTGEITIADHSGLSTRLLHSARLNVMSTPSRNALVKALNTAKNWDGWAKALEDVCYLAKDHYRQGDPLVDLANLPPAERPRWLVWPFIEFGGPTVLFGDGGTGKSFFATAFCASIAGGFSLVGTLKSAPMSVLYLDWETDQWTHAARLKAICAAIDRQPPQGVFYRRQTASLEASAANLRREIAKRNIGFCVIDSMAAALGGEPESADATLRMFNAARSLGIPWLGIAHITKSNGTNGDARKPFGSVFGHNMARMTWGAEAAQDAGEDYKGITITNYKCNNGRIQKPQTYRLQFHNDDQDNLLGVDISSCDVADFPSLAAKLPLRQRILTALKAGMHTYEELEAETGADNHQLRARMTELVRSGDVINIPVGKTSNFGLASRREGSF